MLSQTITNAAIFVFAAVADKNKGMLYTDATWALPVMVLSSKQYYYVPYDYNSNYTNARAVKDLKDETIGTAFNGVFEEIEQKWHKPTLNITDNQAVTPLKQYMASKDCRWKFVEPSNHRVNAAERAIQTFKNHIISGMCSTAR